MQQTLILLAAGFAAGLLSGFVGVGGGIVVIPILVAFLGFSQKEAQGTSLGLLLLPIGILAVINYYKAGYINIKAVGVMATTFVLGSYLSSKIVVDLPDDLIKKIFAVFLLFVALKLFLGK